MPLIGVNTLRQRRIGSGKVKLTYRDVVELLQYASPGPLGTFVVTAQRKYYRGKREVGSEELKVQKFMSLRMALALYSRWSGERVGGVARRKLLMEALRFRGLERAADLEWFTSRKAEAEFRWLREWFERERRKPSRRLREWLLGYEELLMAARELLRKERRRGGRGLRRLERVIEGRRHEMERMIRETGARELLESAADFQESPTSTS
jgi:hypothetical protein